MFILEETVFRTITNRKNVQRFFGSVVLSDVLISLLKPLPSLTDKLISQTHGQPF
jgi:hypothetical protein